MEHSEGVKNYVLTWTELPKRLSKKTANYRTRHTDNRIYVLPPPKTIRYFYKHINIKYKCI